MKKVFYYIIGTLLIYSCDEVLVETPKDFVSKTNFYQNEADAEAAITGAYSTFDKDYFTIEYYFLWELQGDFLNGRGSQAPVSDMSRILDPTNVGRVSVAYSKLYQAINRANAVIENVSEMRNIQESTKNRILAEAFFLRAYIYFDLVRGWGPVPLRMNEVKDLSSIDAPRAAKEDIYKLIIEDALKAELGLPESVGSKTGRPSKYTAKMLLSQVYLDMEQWSKAAEKSNEIIESGQFSLVGVKEPNDFYKIFASETHSEDIFSLHHSATKQAWLPRYLHIVGAFPYNYMPFGYFAWLPIVSGNSFIGDSWDDKDLRKSFNLYSKYVNANGDSVSLPSTTPVLFKKFISDEQGLCVFSVPIYRYSEAFLMYAEASSMAEGSPSSLALERLNMIKRRAYAYDPSAPSPVDYKSGLTKETFRDIVLQERGYEFLIERRRWWDLKRTGKAKEMFSKIGKNFIVERNLWPIPQDEINNNSLITQDDQNPGY